MAANGLLSLCNVLEAGLSAYALYHCTISVRNMRVYEDASVRAARYSNIAEDQLSQTQTTLGVGTIAVCATLQLSGKDAKND